MVGFVRCRPRNGVIHRHLRGRRRRCSRGSFRRGSFCRCGRRCVFLFRRSHAVLGLGPRRYRRHVTMPVGHDTATTCATGRNVTETLLVRRLGVLASTSPHQNPVNKKDTDYNLNRLISHENRSVSQLLNIQHTFNVYQHVSTCFNRLSQIAKPGFLQMIQMPEGDAAAACASGPISRSTRRA